MNGIKSSKIINNICCQVNKLQSAHYAIIIPQEARIKKFGESVINSLNNKTEINCRLFTTHDNELVMESQYNDEKISIKNYDTYIEKLFLKHKHLLIIVDCFEKLDVKKQCNFLAQSRSIREESLQNQSYQLIVSGAWNYKLLKKQFIESHGSSPPLDSSDLYNISYFDSVKYRLKKS